MATEWENPPDADVILRTSGGKELHAHKLILSFASPVFRDMFSIPQSSVGSSQTPIIDVDDPPEALEMFLQIIYPTPNPPINDFKMYASLLCLKDKYDAKAILDALKYSLPLLGKSSPLQTYAILCASGQEWEVQNAARRTPFESLIHPDSGPLLNLLTVMQYRRLVAFMVTRDEKTRQIVRWHKEDSWAISFLGSRCNTVAHKSYARAIVDVVRTAFEEDPCVTAEEVQSLLLSEPAKYSGCRLDCKCGTGLQEQGERLRKELVEMGERLLWM